MRQSASSAMLLQPALTVGAVNDPAEVEAEKMAARVVSTSGPLLDTPVSPKPGSSGVARSTEDQPNLDSLDAGSVPSEHADVEVSQSQDVATDGLTGEDTGELDAGQPADTSGEAPAPEAPPIEDAPPPILPARGDSGGAVVGREGGAAPNDVAQIVAHPGPGARLPRSVRQRIEPHFGVSFDKVRIHQTSADKRAASRIGARAFTHKNNIWLGENESVNDTRLIAHELTHVVQQTMGSDKLPLAREPVINRFPGEDWLEGKARHIPGYSLMTVLLGRKLISGDKVQMTGENLLGGFLGLIPGGTLIFDKLKETRVIQDAFTWVRGRLQELNLTGSRVRNVLSKIPGDLSWTSPFDSLKRIFGPLVNDLITFVGEIKDKILEFIIKGALKLAGPYADKVWGVIQNARESIGLILSDPLGFAKNLVVSIVGGFKQFGTNILKHLKNGLLGWLFGAIGDAGISMPEKLDFKGLLSLGLQILGLTYENFRKKLVKKLGPKGEKMVSMLESSVEVVKVLLKEGFVGIWQKLLGMIENFRQTMIGGISEMVITTVIRAGIGWLAGLSNPVGAVLKVVLAIYDLIVAFIERLDQIMDVAQSIFSSVGAIARGATANAANFIEQTIGRTVPVVISFLAALLGLGGISSKIRNVIMKLRKPVDKALGKLLSFLIKKAKKLFSKLISKVNGKRKYPSKNFKIGKKQHRIFAEKQGKKLVVKIASKKPKVIDEIEARHKAQIKLVKDAEGAGAAEALKIGTGVQKQTTDADDETAVEAKKIKPASEKENQLAKLKLLEKELAEAAKELEASAKNIDGNPHISSQTDEALFRAAEPRLQGFEGAHNTHRELRARAKGPMSSLISDPVSSFYEMDHTLEKRFPKAILENLQLIDPAEAANRQDKPVQEKKDRASRAGVFNEKLKKAQDKGRRSGEKPAGESAAVKSQNAAPFGEIGKKGFDRIPEDAPDFPAVAVYRHNHVKAKGLKNHADQIKQARTQADPHQALKKSIKAQLNLEIDQMRKQANADKSMPAQIKKDFNKGLDDAQARNKILYALGNTRARKVEEDEKNNVSAKETSSNLLFTGGSGAPNFLEKEGVGGAFNGLKGMTEHLERDHVIDKAYPKHVAALPLITEQDATAIEAEVIARNKQMTDDRTARLNELKAMKIYPPGSAMAKYTDARGYAIPLYKALARRVTSSTGTSMSKEQFAAAVQGKAISDLAAYVITGNAGKLADARRAKTTPIAPIMRDRTLKHASEIAGEYATELQTVGANQESETAKKEAKANMARIAGQVNTSLSVARQQTEVLLR